MKQAMAFTLALAFSPLLAAEDSDPLGCVDTLISAAFLTGMGSQSRPRITQDIPEMFKGLQSLDELSFLGNRGGKSGNYRSTNLGFFSTLPGETVKGRISQYLADRGWKKEENAAVTRRGFRSSRQPDYLTMCSEKHGQASLRVRSHGDGTVVNLVTYAVPNRGCNQNDARAMMMNSRLNLPDLDLPPGAQMTFNGGLGSSGGSDGASSRASFTVALTPAEVLAHFDQQIDAQGWQLDGGWEGDTISGSSWIKRDGDERHAGVLSLVSENDKYDVRFSVRPIY